MRAVGLLDACSLGVERELPQFAPPLPPRGPLSTASTTRGVTWGCASALWCRRSWRTWHMFWQSCEARRAPEAPNSRLAGMFSRAGRCHELGVAVCILAGLCFVSQHGAPAFVVMPVLFLPHLRVWPYSNSLATLHKCRQLPRRQRDSPHSSHAPFAQCSGAGTHSFEIVTHVVVRWCLMLAWAVSSEALRGLRHLVPKFRRHSPLPTSTVLLGHIFSGLACFGQLALRVGPGIGIAELAHRAWVCSTAAICDGEAKHSGPEPAGPRQARPPLDLRMLLVAQVRVQAQDLRR